RARRATVRYGLARRCGLSTRMQETKRLPLRDSRQGQNQLLRLSLGRTLSNAPRYTQTVNNFNPVSRRCLVPPIAYSSSNLFLEEYGDPVEDFESVASRTARPASRSGSARCSWGAYTSSRVNVATYECVNRRVSHHAVGLRRDRSFAIVAPSAP